MPTVMEPPDRVQVPTLGRIVDAVDQMADALAAVSTTVYGLEPVAPELLPADLRGQYQLAAEAVVAAQMPLVRDRAVSRTVRYVLACLEASVDGPIPSGLLPDIEKALGHMLTEYPRQLRAALAEARR